MNFVEYVIISIDQLKSRDRTSVRKIAAQNNKGCGFFLYKQEPENTNSKHLTFNTYKALIRTRSKRFTSIVLQYDLEI